MDRGEKDGGKMTPQIHTQPALPQHLAVNVNGTYFYPLNDAERLKELDHIAKTTEAVTLLHQKVLNEREQMQELAKCMGDFVYFCNFYVKTFDPRRTPSAIPFILYNYQVEAAEKIIAAIKNGTSLLIEKSRDLGASWLIMTVITWYWLFTPEFHAHVGSRVEDQVDNGTVDSLLGKVDYILSHLPPWFRRVIPYDDKYCKKSLQRSTYEGSLISGESSNPNFGRGVRKAVTYIDEFAYVENDRAIWTGIGDVSPCKIVASTPSGKHNMFAELRFSQKIDVLTFHWTQHPLKTYDWYCKAKIERTPQAVASELDVDYEASGGQKAFPELILHKNKIVVPAFNPDPKDFHFDMGLDFGTVNPAALPVIMRERYMSKSAKWPRQWVVWEYYAPSTLAQLADAILSCPFYSLAKNIWADPSMFFNNQTADDGKAVTNLAELFAKHYQIRLSQGKRGDAFVLQQVKEAWADSNNISLYIFNTCPHFISEFEGLHYREQSSLQAQRRNQPEALADKNNHLWDAFKYYFNQTFRAPVVITEAVKKGWDAINEDIATLRGNIIKRLTTKQTAHQRRYWR